MTEMQMMQQEVEKLQAFIDSRNAEYLSPFMSKLTMPKLNYALYELKLALDDMVEIAALDTIHQVC